jgi:type III secretory pathway component EscV
MAGEQVNRDWSVSETLNTSIPASALENSSTDLIIVGIVLPGVPMLLLIVMIVVHLALRCTATQKTEKEAKDSSANQSVTVDMTASHHASSNSAV